MHEKNWYILTKDKEGLTGLWRKLTKNPSYKEFEADITSIRGDQDISKDIGDAQKEKQPLIQHIGKNRYDWRR